MSYYFLASYFEVRDPPGRVCSSQTGRIWGVSFCPHRCRVADQKRWFKVWTTIALDPTFLSLPVECIGRWTLLGAWIAAHGQNGRITASTEAIRHALRIGSRVVKDAILELPHVTLEEGIDDNASITVIMSNWSKYQLDSTGYERLKRHRNKANDNGAREDKEKTKTKTRPREEKKPDNTSPPAEEQWPSPRLLIAKYNSESPDECPAVKTISPGRLQKAKKYLIAFPSEEFWTGVFRQIHLSQFLRGLKNANGHESFVADFDWLLTKGKDGSENAVKVRDGRYRDG